MYLTIRVISEDWEILASLSSDQDLPLKLLKGRTFSGLTPICDKLYTLSKWLIDNIDGGTGGGGGTSSLRNIHALGCLADDSQSWDFIVPSPGLLYDIAHYKLTSYCATYINNVVYLNIEELGYRLSRFPPTAARCESRGRATRRWYGYAEQ